MSKCSTHCVDRSSIVFVGLTIVLKLSYGAFHNRKTAMGGGESFVPMEPMYVLADKVFSAASVARTKYEIVV